MQFLELWKRLPEDLESVRIHGLQAHRSKSFVGSDPKQFTDVVSEVKILVPPLRAVDAALRNS